MNTTSDLSIVIPAKNEAKLIPQLLHSLMRQDYSKISSTQVLVADAGSSDGTAEIVLGFKDRLRVDVIPGGLPSVGRNAGARRVDTPYVLFMDADVVPASVSLIRRALERAQGDRLHCVTTNIICQSSKFMDRMLYWSNNLFAYLSCIHHPYSTGMFMLFDTRRFRELGGFHEQVLFAEDYLLSKQVARNKFAIVRGGVYTSNRRFERMGHFRVATLFLATALNSWNRQYFLRDHKYWAS
jgi:glycosyltransferase involved in cell wall biosynthesis